MFTRSKKPVCVGLDVHKDNVWASVCILERRDKQDVFNFQNRKFPSNHTDLVSMCSWIKSLCTKELPLYDPSQIEVYMESTGKYSTPVYNTIEDEGMIPYMVNPKHVRIIDGQKTDQKDCQWIAELGMNGLLRKSYIPERLIREGRRISRSRTKQVQARNDIARRIQNIQVEANIRTELIFSDPMGESARDVMTHLICAVNPTLDSVRSKIKKTCRIVRYKDDADRKEKEEELLKAFDGARFSSSQKFDMKSSQAAYDTFNKRIADYENMMTEMTEPYKYLIEIMVTMPGISELSARQILFEIGADMKAFKNEKSFIKWCGLAPGTDQSNGKHKTNRIGKGGKHLKPILNQCALVAIKHPYYAAKYKTIAARRGKKRAVMAICRKMMVSLYHMLLTGEIFQPKDMNEEDGTVRTSKTKKPGTAELKKQMADYVQSKEEVDQDMIEMALNILKKGNYEVTKDESGVLITPI